MPIGTSVENQGIADLAHESSVLAREEDRLTLLDLLLERVMVISAIEDPIDLLVSLNELENFIKTFKGVVADQVVTA